MNEEEGVDRFSIVTISGLITGIVIGIVSDEIMKRIKKIHF